MQGGASKAQGDRPPTGHARRAFPPNASSTSGAAATNGAANASGTATASSSAGSSVDGDVRPAPTSVEVAQGTNGGNNHSLSIPSNSNKDASSGGNTTVASGENSPKPGGSTVTSMVRSGKLPPVQSLFDLEVSDAVIVLLFCV